MVRSTAASTYRAPARFTGVAAAVLGAGLLAACSGSTSGSGVATGASPTASPTSSASRSSSAPGSSAPPSAPATVTSTVPASTSGNGSDDSSSPASGSGSNGASEYCKEKQLRAELDPRAVAGSGRNGNLAIIVDFTNTSGSSCVVYGYPGAALEDSAGKQVKQATRTIRGKLLGLPSTQHSLPRVTLRPGAVASAGIEGVNQQEQGAAQAGCDAKYPRILVTPPNTSTPVPFTYRWPVCYSFTVHPTNIEKDPPH